MAEALLNRGACVLALLMCMHPLTSISQTVPGEQTVATINAIAKKYQGRTICSQQATVRDGVAAVNAYVNMRPEKRGQFSDKDIYDALVEAFPCPFNPNSVPARRATVDDLVGFWTLAPNSRQLSPMIFKFDPYPGKCQYFGFYADRDLRMLSVLNTNVCPQVSGKDFSRALPGTISWRIDSTGLVEVTRSDQPIIEKWDVFVVSEPFTQAGSSFIPGDLIMYLSQYNRDNKQGTGTLYFRHLQKLAQ